MISVTRDATINWPGHPPGGEPRLTVGTHSLTDSPPLNLDLDILHPLATSPLELLAGAIGSVFARFVAEQLVKEGTPAREIVTRLSLTLSGEADDQSDLMVRAVACRLSARVAGTDQSHLQALAQTALTRCMESLGMRTEGIEVTVEATLLGRLDRVNGRDADGAGLGRRPGARH
jgi:organic hydroperoxide reductase OsmC/OhrA